MIYYLLFIIYYLLIIFTIYYNDLVRIHYFSLVKYSLMDKMNEIL